MLNGGTSSTATDPLRGRQSCQPALQPGLPRASAPGQSSAGLGPARACDTSAPCKGSTQPAPGPAWLHSPGVIEVENEVRSWGGEEEKC